MKDRVNWMIDLETLGVRPGSVVRNIAMIPFRLNVRETDEALMDKALSIWVDPEEQIKLGRYIQRGTKDWWQKQWARARHESRKEEYAYQVLNTHPEDVSVKRACQAFTGYMNEVGADGFIMSRGANFDYPILEALFDDAGMTVPWDTWKVTCSRSIIRFMCQDSYDLEFTLANKRSNHTAVYDCIVEINKLQTVFEALNE